MKRRHRLTALIALTIIAALLAYGAAIHWWFTHEQEPVVTADTVGWRTVTRDAARRAEGEFRTWHRDSGFLAMKSWVSSGVQTHYSCYDPSGRVFKTMTRDSNGVQVRTTPRLLGSGDKSDIGPPWLNGAADQVAPTAPWIQLGIPVDEWISSWETRQ